MSAVGQILSAKWLVTQCQQRQQYLNIWCSAEVQLSMFHELLPLLYKQLQDAELLVLICKLDMHEELLPGSLLSHDTFRP